MNTFDTDYKYLALGVLGAILTIYGHLFQNVPHFYYIVGSIALMIMAIHYELVYFIALELILAAGHTAILIGFGLYTQIALPILLCLQLLLFYLMFGKENLLITIIGILGIIMISFGFSYHDPWVFFVGSLCIAGYSAYIGYRGCAPAYLWAVVNAVFAITALYRILNIH